MTGATLRGELVSIPTDTTPLDGLLYEPEGGALAGAVIFFHGNTMNFYVGPPRFLPPRLIAMGFACLAFNRRAHDVLSVRGDKERMEGGAFQTTAEALADHATAADWLAGRGYPAPVVIGHSNGGMMAAPHVAERPDTPALVLLSAGRGGPAQTQRDGLLAGSRLPEMRRRAEEMVAAGRGDELMLMPGWWYVITARSFLDRITTVPDLLAYAPAIACPTLYVRGDTEPEATFPGTRFRDLTAGPCESVVVPGCDHFYNGREAQVTAIVADFLHRWVSP
ncbi:alpha/beta hydrolase [Micromonospora sp. WMMD1128]|uniref:alpha/beta hydrolase family protein n=1 Tax=Micromonospora sp. WMMD1128 TaxID=3015150 RepID=UPI00248B41E0|nr:alpha/beta hydrolase [Micromonospora sp. WMMD1128]WBB71330.1 alpha/beta hydrolase [Micromonospora sp. WMMD1128]